MPEQHEIDVDGTTYRVDVRTNSDGWISASCADVPGAEVGHQTIFGNEAHPRVPDSMVQAIRDRVQRM
ncbi:MAG: hypothetical protein V1760_01830 [Candidatus Peregrinibacteria bacterium]